MTHSAGTRRLALLLAALSPGAWTGCTRTLVETEIVERVDTLRVSDTVVVVDTVREGPSPYEVVLVAEGLGPISGHLTDAAMTATGPVVGEQRGVVQSMDGGEVWRLPVPASEFGGLLGLAELEGALYAAYSDSLKRLTVSDRSGRVVYRSGPYAIQHFGGGLATHGGKLLLGYGNGVDYTGPGDPRHGGVVAIDPVTLHVDTLAVGLRNPFKLAAWGDTLVVSSSGEFLHEGIYAFLLGAPDVADFGYPAWEGPVCHLAGRCPPRTPPWYTYPTAAFGCSAVVGGAVWDGRYWFADFCEGWIRTLDRDGRVTHRFDLPGRLSGLKNVGGTLYVLGYDGGRVWRVGRAEGVAQAPADGPPP
ncbi:MAG: hypothetical protein AMXMBFR53_25000 [Gemmatimonadota bacterium]